MKTRTMVALGVAALLAAAGPAAAQGKQEIKIGAMPLNTWWYVAGATFAKLLGPELPAGSHVEVLARGGGIANPVVVNEGKAQIALSNVATAVWAWQGEPEIYKGKQYRDIRSLVGGINAIWVVAMLREEYIRRTDNDTLEKALTSPKPLRVIMKPAGSSVPPVARMILDALGTSFEKIKANGGSLIQVDAAQITSMLRDGRADLYFETAAKGHPAVTEVTLTADVRFVDLPEKALKRLAEAGLKPGHMPQWFKGQSGPVRGVDLGTSVIAHKDLADSIAYTFTRTVVENRDKLVAAHAAFGDFKPEEAWKPENNGIPLHPGAARYYRERGWLKN